jgi:calcineurin-like phosphoesterase family protein
MKLIKLQSKPFFTSDIHLSHRNIIKHCNRPFGDVNEMNEGVVQKWNRKVGPKDHVFVAGDIVFGTSSKRSLERNLEYLYRLNGTLYLAIGNHDHPLLKNEEFLARFEYAAPLIEVNVFDESHRMASNKINYQKIVVCHYAMKTFNLAHRGAWQLFGHSHGTAPHFENSQQLDIGIDCWNMEPASYDEVKAKLATLKPFVSEDHHE